MQGQMKGDNWTLTMSEFFHFLFIFSLLLLPVVPILGNHLLPLVDQFLQKTKIEILMHPLSIHHKEDVLIKD